MEEETTQTPLYDYNISNTSEAEAFNWINVTGNGTGNGTYDNSTEAMEDYYYIDFDNLPMQQVYYFFMRYIAMILILIGTVGNCLSLLIMNRPQIRTSVTSYFLRVLAVFDTLVLWLGYFRHWIKENFGFRIRIQGYLGCNIHIFILYWTMHLSSWVLVAVAVERVISVSFPHSSKKICTKRFAKFVILGLCLASFALNGHFLFIMYVHTYPEDGYQTCTHYEQYDYFWSPVWQWLDLTLLSLVPFVLITVCNATIILKVILSSIKSAGASTKKIKMTSMTVTLLSVGFVYLLATLPASIYFIYVNNDLVLQSWYELAEVNMYYSITTFLTYCNNALNFFLYCISSKHFRGELLALICKTKVEAREISMTAVSNTGTTRVTKVNETTKG